MRAPLPDASCQVSKSWAFLLWRRRFFKVFAIYSHGGHLGHVIVVCSPFQRKLHMKFGFDWPCGFRGDL